MNQDTSSQFLKTTLFMMTLVSIWSDFIKKQNQSNDFPEYLNFIPHTAVYSHRL